MRLSSPSGHMRVRTDSRRREKRLASLRPFPEGILQGRNSERESWRVAPVFLWNQFPPTQRGEVSGFRGDPPMSEQ